MVVNRLRRDRVKRFLSKGGEQLPGLANVLKIMSRVAPEFMFKQLTKMSRPK
jgi:hypothetical protein